MKHSKKWLFASSVAAVIAVGFWLNHEDPATAMVHSIAPKNVIADSSPIPIKTPSQGPFVIDAHSAPETEEVWMTQAVKEQMADIADAYATNIRFPIYSKPLSKNDWALLNPRPFVQKKVSLDINEQLSASIVLPHYIVHQDQDLPVEVHVTGLGSVNVDVDSIQAYLPDGASSQNAVRLSYQSESDGSLVYGGVIPAEALETQKSLETHVLADISFSDNQQAKVSAVFKLVGTDATLTGLDASYVDGEHLIIPAKFDVNIDGYYRVQANLFDKQSNNPISHINASFVLNGNENQGLLKVHAVTLRAQGYAGPYVLRDINITRGPARPGDRTGYGTASIEQYDVEGYDLSIYDDTEYVDPKSQRRLDFLKRLAGAQ